MSVTEAAVIAALRPVQDPELHRSIVDLGMVRSTTIDGGHVEVGIDSRSQLSLRNQIQSEVTEAVTALDGVNLVSIDFGVMTDEQRAKVREMLHGNPAATAGSQAAHGHAEAERSRSPRPVTAPAFADCVRQGRRRQVVGHRQPGYRACAAG